MVEFEMEVIIMSSILRADIPLKSLHKIQEALAELEKAISPYKPKFLARMYRARASDLEGKGKSLAEIKRRFKEKG